MIYEAPNCTFKIFKPNMPLKTWLSKQKEVPKYLLNCSLYEAPNKPIGTIIESGKLVHNDGYGYGYGTINNELYFGGPWDRGYDEFLTGYISPVQNGKYVAPSFKDSYVFDSKLNRIGVGRKNGIPYILTCDSVTLKGFAQYAIDNGFEALVNNDGGLSRFLAVDGKIIYNSTRTPYNALAIYEKKPIVTEKPTTVTQQKPVEKPKKTYTVKYGDCWWSIAANHLGSGLKMFELASANGKTIYTALRPGDILTIPEA